MNDTDLFIVSAQTLRELAKAWDDADTRRVYHALDACKAQPIDLAMNHLCNLTTEINDNGSMTIRMTKFAPIPGRASDHKRS